jgi:nucleoid-associated protein EbfC
VNLGNIGNMGKMLKQVQKLQAEMARVQEELGAERVEASAGGGVVRAVANGHGELIELVIDPAAVDPSDVAMLQDLVLAAVNEVQRNARSLAESKMKVVTGGLPLPGLLGS